MQFAVAGTQSNTPWSIISMELELSPIEVSDEAESFIRSVTPINKPIYTWRHYVNTIRILGVTMLILCLQIQRKILAALSQ